MNNLRKLRLKLGLTLREIEEKTGINKDYLSLMENDKRPINNRNMKTLCEFYKVKPNELLGMDDMIEIDENANTFSRDDLKLLRAIKSLPTEDYDLLMDFVDYLIYRHQKRINNYYDKKRNEN